MKYATRINSFLRTAPDVETALEQIASTGSITHVDLNYPEHFGEKSNQEVREMLDRVGLTINSVAMRFRDHYLGGEYTNADPQVRADAIALTKKGIDAAADLGAEVVTVWLGFDGYDYTFQKDYAQAIGLAVSAFQELADHRPEVKISIEYKPYEERVFALIPNGGVTLHMLHEIDRPNVGATLDFCHQLMAGEMPAFAASLLLDRGKLYGIHLNDGNNAVDDGLMIGSIHPFETAELLYYLSRYNYDGVIYFDTFPKRESAVEEAAANVTMTELLLKKVAALGIDRITDVIRTSDGIQSQSIRTALLTEV